MSYEAHVVKLQHPVKRIVITFHRIHSGFVLYRWEYNPQCSRLHGSALSVCNTSVYRTCSSMVLSPPSHFDRTTPLAE